MLHRDQYIVQSPPEKPWKCLEKRTGLGSYYDAPTRADRSAQRPTADGMALPGSRKLLVFLLHGFTNRNRPFPPGKSKCPWRRGWWMETLGAPADNERAAELAFCSAQPSCTSHLPFRAVLLARHPHSLAGLRL
jgi:hypothetical protein